MQCFVMSAHEAVANMTQCVAPAFHGETMGGYPRTVETGNQNIYRLPITAHVYIGFGVVDQ